MISTIQCSPKCQLPGRINEWMGGGATPGLWNKLGNILSRTLPVLLSSSDSWGCKRRLPPKICTRWKKKIYIYKNSQRSHKKHEMVRAAGGTLKELPNSLQSSVYLLEHVVDDEKQIYDLGSNDKDVEAAWWLVEANALQLADKLERSCRNKSNTLSLGFPHALLISFLIFFFFESSMATVWISPTAAVSNSSVTTQKRLTLAL